MKKLLSIILTVCMLFSLVIVPVTVNAEETATVTLQYLDGTTAVANINEEGKIVYPALEAELNFDHVWSLNQKKYEEAPETATADITVYELKSKTLSFENYPIADENGVEDSKSAYEHGGAVSCDTDLNTTVSTEEAYSGTHSMKLRDHFIKLRDKEPADWATGGWKSHYEYDEAQKKWIVLTAKYSTAPTFVEYKYGYERKQVGYEVGLTPVKYFKKNELPTKINYMITFKYKATSNNSKASSLVVRLQSELKANYEPPAANLEGSFTFSAGATNGWVDGSFIVSTDSPAWYEGHNHVLDLHWLPNGTDRYAREIYIDDVRIIDMNNFDGVTYEDKNGKITVAEYEVGDTINYPTTPASFKDYYVWSKSKTEYIPAPITFSESVKVYQIKSDVQSFQTDMPAINNLYNPEKYPGGMPYDEGYNDHRSMRVRNYNVRTTTTVLTESNCTGFYYYDAATDSYKSITLDMFKACGSDYATYVAKYGNVYQRRGNPSEHSIIPVYQYSSKPATDSVKLTFKYKFIQHENNNTNKKVKVFAVVSHSTTADEKYIKYDTQAINLSYSTSDEWQTACLYADIDTSKEGLGTGSLDNTPVLSIKFEDEGGWNTSVASTFTLLIDDVKYESLGNTPTVYLHNGDEVTKVTDGVTAGSSFDLTTIGFIPKAPAGKYFIGWAKSATSASLITSIAVPSTKPYVDVYAVYKDCVDDGDTFSFLRSSSPDAKGYPYIYNDKYYTNLINRYGRGGMGSRSTNATDGIIVGKATTYGAIKWNPDNPRAGAQLDAEGQLVAHDEKLPKGEQTLSKEWEQNYHYLLARDDGSVIVADKNSKYAVLVTYKKAGGGRISFDVGVGISKANAYVENNNNLNAKNCLEYTDKSVDLTNVEKNDEWLNHVFYIETGDETDVLPIFGIHTKHSGFVIESVEEDANGIKSAVYNDDKTYYPYKIVDYPRVAIKEIKIIKIDDGNSVVAYNYYEGDGKFTIDMQERKIGSALDADTNNFDTKWYSDKITQGRRIVTTYPEVSFKNYYNAAYTQIEHPNADGQTNVFLFGDGKKKGASGKTITFENARYDDKYTLHVAANGEVKTNDYEVFMLENDLVPGNTYKVSFKYKTDICNSAFGFNLTTSLDLGFGFFDTSDTPVKATVNIDAGESNGEWIERVVYFTADFIGSVTDNNEIGRDYQDIVYSANRALYFNFFQGEGANDIYFADFVIEDLGTPVVAAGASKLKDDYANQIEQQAIRYYFNYKTVDGSTLEFSNGDTLRVVERGFYFRNGLSYVGKDAEENLLTDFTVPIFKTSTAKSAKTSDFHKCWAYNQSTGIMTFSTYVTNFALNDPRKLEVRGYVKVIDEATGEKFTIYAKESINRTVGGIFGEEATDKDINAGLGKTEN